MTEIQVRLAEAPDADRLDAALRQLSVTIGDAHAATSASLRAAGFGNNPVFRAQIAEADGEIVGAALYSPVFSTIRGGPGIYLSDLWVAETVRGSGLGARLLRAVAHDAGAVWQARFLKLAVYDDNPRARSFYDRLGFEAAIGEIVLTLGADQFAALTSTPGGPQ
ncbi:N-acetyltransferase family protein [Amorphus sp. 3PC139-8]|uniref:GNAT family N-acetyltransferase n=1 Tax=Amorphus sp. 3PC139-8 TaxID=2735676 RepID=UPI00345DBA86